MIFWSTYSRIVCQAYWVMNTKQTEISRTLPLWRCSCQRTEEHKTNRMEYVEMDWSIHINLPTVAMTVIESAENYYEYVIPLFIIYSYNVRWSNSNGIIKLLINSSTTSKIRRLLLVLLSATEVSCNSSAALYVSVVYLTAEPFP